MEDQQENAVWMLVDLIEAEGVEVEFHGVPRERLEGALRERYPTADVAAVFERLPAALSQFEDEVAMARCEAEQIRQAEEWAALKPAREAAREAGREAYRRVAGFYPPSRYALFGDNDLLPF